LKYICLDIETTGLMPWYGHRVTTICAETEDGEEFALCDSEESTIIQEFYTWLSFSSTEYFLLTKNGKQFDIPFYLARAAQNFEAEDFLALMETVLSYAHHDLQYVTKNWIKLEAMAYLLGVGLKKGKDNPITLWANNQHADLIEHCKTDVKLTIGSYKRLLELYPRESKPEFRQR